MGIGVFDKKIMELTFFGTSTISHHALHKLPETGLVEQSLKYLSVPFVLATEPLARVCVMDLFKRKN